MIKKIKNKVQFSIEKKKINKESPTFIIAEIAQGYEGKKRLFK